MCGPNMNTNQKHGYASCISCRKKETDTYTLNIKRDKGRPIRFSNGKNGPFDRELSTNSFDRDNTYMLTYKYSHIYMYIHEYIHICMHNSFEPDYLYACTSS